MAILREQGLKVGQLGWFGKEGAGSQHQNAGCERNGQNNLDCAGGIHAPVIHPAEQHQYGWNKDDFSRIDVPAGNRIHEANVKNAGHKIARQQNKGHSVCRYHADIAQDERPAANESPFCAKTGVCVCKGPPGNRIGLDQKTVAQGHYALKESADKKGDHRAEGAGIRQKAQGGQDKASPAHNGSQGQGQNLNRI